jgi:hypothetical protein
MPQQGQSRGMRPRNITAQACGPKMSVTYKGVVFARSGSKPEAGS